MPRADSNSTASRDWEAEYRALLADVDRSEADWSERERWFFKTLLKLALRYQHRSPEIDAKLGGVRELFRAESDSRERQEALSDLIDDCLSLDAAVPAPAQPEQPSPERAALAQIVRDLRVPPQREFEARQLSEKLLAGRNHEQSLRFLKEFIDECINETVASGDSSQPRALPHPVLVHLLDWLLLPSEFEQRANSLKNALGAAANDDPVRDTASLLNDFHAFLRHDVRDLEGYLKTASSELCAIQADMSNALESYASAQSETTEFGRRMTEGVEQIHAVFESPSDRHSLKAGIEARLKAMRTALDEFLDLEGQRREDHVSRSQKLTARLQQLESETNVLRTRLAESQARARVDPLTGAPNRLALEDQLRKELERSRRHGHPLSYAVLDLDHFKRINDSYGHAAGDKVLRQVARLCMKKLRTNDFFARFGGEEFVILLPDTGAEDALTVADKLCETIRRVRFHSAGERVDVTLSIGVAGLRAGDSMQSLFERADKALYEAKSGGRDRVVRAPG